MISFIVPAHHEQAWIGRCVAAIHNAARAVGEPYEVIVVDDASTDATAEIARQNGAEVIRVEHRHISATRNAGALHSRGDVLIFVDADSLVNAPIVKQVLEAVSDGAVGGGCVPQFEGDLPLWWQLLGPVFTGSGRLLKLTGGACQFCTRTAFDACGGFSLEHFAAEDLQFIKSLKRQGRYVVLAEPVTTSGRSLRNHSPWKIFWLLGWLIVRGPNTFRSRESSKMWYEVKREEM
jgi:glycosyltransferase involved in cell wall biosynthesis